VAGSDASGFFDSASRDEAARGSAQNDVRFGERGVRWRSVAVIVLAWLVLQVGGLFSPGLLDDVDSVYLEIAREMLHRHDYVTPYIDGVRFFDKPPLMYWMAAGSMKVFGEHDWAARMPLALAMLGLLLAVYGLGRRLYGERGGFYGALVLGTAIGPYLYTRFFIPDILICLWMTLGVWFFLVGLAGAGVIAAGPTHRDEAAMNGARRSVTWASVGFGAVLGLNLLTKGLIGMVFPLGFVAVYLVVTRQVRLLKRMRVWLGGLVFAGVALPWHVLAALRNPAIAMPGGVGLPAKAGWAWFYLYNEHFARFLGKRIPHDYGNTPVWLFWVYAVVWVMPWGVFLPAAVGGLRRALGHHLPVTVRQREAALTVTVWVGIVMVFFSVSSRQEYYSLPALPALALMVGGVLAAADEKARRCVVGCHRWVLLPVAVLVAGVCGYFAVMAPRPGAGVDLASLLATNKEMYNLSLGHLFDLTGAAMGLFRGPLAWVAVGMAVLGVGSYLLRRRGWDYAANLTLAGGMIVVLMAAHEGLVRFNPILGSKGLALAIVDEQRAKPESGDLILVDGELTSGSTLLFYTRQPVHLVNGRVNGPWFGSFWPDAPGIFEDESSLRRLWAGPARVFLLTYDARVREGELGGRVLAQAGGKTVLVNR
jgi:4-amino-4-deoxy-L-arabinose transferase-like glycosyltransferase